MEGFIAYLYGSPYGALYYKNPVIRQALEEVAEATSVRPSEAEVPDVTDLLSGVVHTSHSEGLDLHHLDVSGSSVPSVDGSDPVSSILTEPLVTEFDRTLVDRSQFSVQ